MDASHEQTQRCPECAEDIRTEATKCRFCGTRFDELREPELISRWIRTNSTLALSLTTFLFVVFQVAKASGFEVNTIEELLHSSGLASIVIGVLVAQLPLLLMLLSLASSWWILAASRATRLREITPARTSRLDHRTRTADPRIPPLLFLVSLFIVSFYTTPWPLFLFSTAAAVSSSWLSYRREAGHPDAQRTDRRVRRALVACSLFFLLIMLQRPTIWFASERLDTSEHTTVVGYVINGGDGWVTLLAPDHRIIRLRAETIVGRRPCALEFAEGRLFGRVLRLRPIQLPSAVRRGDIPKSLTPACSDG